MLSKLGATAAHVGSVKQCGLRCCTPSMVGGKSIDTALFNRGPLEKDLENVSHRGQGIRRTTSGYPKLSVSSSPGEKTHVKSELFLINFYI